jgi:hypothetical protein
MFSNPLMQNLIADVQKSRTWCNNKYSMFQVAEVEWRSSTRQQSAETEVTRYT